jgi:hypothetical protein
MWCNSFKPQVSATGMPVQMQWFMQALGILHILHTTNVVLAYLLETPVPEKYLTVFHNGKTGDKSAHLTTVILILATFS